MKTVIKITSLFISLVFVASCNSSSKAPSEATADSLKMDMDEDTTENTVLYNIPSPTETFITLQLSNAKFDRSLLNPAENISKYETSFSKAVNLGVYSSDLTFCLLYKQNQDINTYLKNTNELTSDLNIKVDFLESITKRVKANSNNLDSMMKIIQEANVGVNIYLNENKMNNTMALVTTGGWVEGLYMIASIADKSNDKEVIALVADQKPVVKNLIKVLEQFQSDKDIAGLLADVKDISTVYESLQTVEVKSKAPVDKEVASVGNNTSFELTKDQLKLILKKAETLRNKLTN